MKTTRKRSLTLLALSPLAMAFASAGLHAADRVDLSLRDLGQLKQAQAAAGPAASTMAHSRHAQLIGLDGESRLVLKKRNTDHAKRNSRYVQTFRGVPIWGENVIVSENASTGEVKALFGTKVSGLASELPDVRANIQPGQAISLAKRAWLGARAGSMNVIREKAEKQIYIDDNGRAHLAYVVSFYADTPRTGQPTRPYVIIDADSGRVLEKWENLQTALIGTGPGGNTKTGQYEYGVDFGFLDVMVNGTTCAMDSPNVETINVEHRFWTPGSPAPSDLEIYEYTCPRNTFEPINGAFAPLNDAHYFGNVIFNMYDDYMDAAPLTFKLEMRVHFANNYENAFWDGTGMTFGDGEDTFYPLVSLDVSGHEVSHGYTEQNSGLIYNNQHSGGMNEAFSDIAGEAAEFFMTGENDFLVGAQIFKSDGALRYMCDPPQDGISIGHASNMPSGGMNNHYSSGVYNKAFCKLATTDGWDTKTAFQAFARANRDYWVPNSTWQQGACGVQEAAKDMTMDVIDVALAFAEVGVYASGTNCGGDGGPNTPPVASFSTTVNGSSVVFADTSTDADGSILARSWSFGDGSTSTDASVTKGFSSPGTYGATLTVFDDDYIGSSTTQAVSIPGSPFTRRYVNGMKYGISDNQTTESPIQVVGAGVLKTAVKIAVNISHSYRGDLIVEAVAPSGRRFMLSNRAGGSADNLIGTYTLDAVGETRAGTWKLVVRDAAAGDVGQINHWSLTFGPVSSPTTGGGRD